MPLRPASDVSGLTEPFSSRLDVCDHVTVNLSRMECYLCQREEKLRDSYTRLHNSYKEFVRRLFVPCTTASKTRFPREELDMAARNLRRCSEHLFERDAHEDGMRFEGEVYDKGGSTKRVQEVVTSYEC